MSTPVEASIPVELTLNITGVYSPGRKAPSRGVNPPEEPDDPETVEDVAIEAVLFETYERIPPSPGTTISFRRGPIITHDILEGVDTSDPNVQLLLSNLLSCVHNAAVEALFAEVGE